jgi:hypothetical protein
MTGKETFARGSKVPSSFSLSPPGERARVRGDRKKLLRLLQNVAADFAVKVPS